MTGDTQHVTHNDFFFFFGIGATIRKRQEIQCLPYVEFLIIGSDQTRKLQLFRALNMCNFLFWLALPSSVSSSYISPLSFQGMREAGAGDDRKYRG